MHLYEVVKPLKFRPASGKPMLTIKPGEPLDEELLDHWYVKAAIDDGRVRLLPDKTKDEAKAEAEAKAKVDAKAKAEADAKAKVDAKDKAAQKAKEGK